MEWKKLLINAALAAAWGAIAAWQASGGELTQAGITAAVFAGLRLGIGYLADRLGKTVPVDE